MQVKLIMQKDKENTLFSSIVSAFERKPKKVYFLFGNVKETGFKIIEEELIDTNIKVFAAIGIDKKNTTRTMLEDMLKYTKDVYVYSNNDLIEYNSNICIFEYANEATVYVSTSNISENGMVNNIAMYTEIIYNLEDKKEKDSYKNQIKEIIKNIEDELFTKLNKAVVQKLVDDKEIFTTRQYNHSVKSISELFGDKANQKEDKKEMSKQETDDIFIQNINIPKVDLSGISIDLDDIDFSGIEDVQENEIKEEKKKVSKKKNNDIEVTYDKSQEDVNNFNDIIQDEQIDKSNELYDESMNEIEFNNEDTLDIADMLFSKANVKLDINNSKKTTNNRSEEENVEEIADEFKEEVVQVKKVNLNNVTNLIFELPTRNSKGQDLNSIKVPNYIKNMIPEFFELSDKVKNVNINGDMYKVRDIKIDVVDVKSGSKFSDMAAKLVYKSGQSYLTFTTDTLKNISYTEKDIIRIIKLASDVYHLEIIQKDLQEYKLWSKLCTQKFKSINRKFGMM